MDSPEENAEASMSHPSAVIFPPAELQMIAAPLKGDNKY